MCRVVPLLLAIAFCFATGRCYASLSAGAARVEITPPVSERPIPLDGYSDRQGRPAQGIHDPLWARALVVGDGKTKIAIVALDLLGVPGRMKENVMSRLQGQGFDPGAVLLCATHTHDGPAAMNDKGDLLPTVLGKFDKALFESTADKIAQAIVQANASLQPARIGVASKYVYGFNRNRRDEFGHTATDPELTLLKVTDASGQPIAVLVNFAAHPTILGGDNMLVSAEWPGVVCETLQREMPGAVALFLNGAQGDQSPAGAEGSDDWARVEDYGRKLAAQALELARTITPSPDAVLASSLEDTVLPEATLPPGLLKLDLPIDPNVAKQFVKVLFPPSAPVGALRLGDLVMLEVPGEMMAGLGVEIKDQVKAMGAAHPIIAGLSNLSLGYVLRSEDYKLGGYEASVSFYGDNLGPTIEAALLRSAEKVLNLPA